MPDPVVPPAPRVPKSRQAKPRQAKPRQAAARPAENGPCTLPESLTIRTAGDFVGVMRTACASGVPVLDGSAVVEVDTAGLQVLLAAAAVARGAGTGLQWSATSPALLGVVAGFGLGDFLGLATAPQSIPMASGQG